MDNLPEHDVRIKPSDEDTSDQAREREEAEDERWEWRAEQEVYRNTDFNPPLHDSRYLY